MWSVQPSPVYCNFNQSNNTAWALLLWHFQNHIWSYMTTISSFHAEHK